MWFPKICQLCILSDRLYFTAVDRVVTEARSAFERIIHRTFCRSYELICAWKGWLYVSLWKLLFVFLYHWHFGGLWTTFLQIIMSKCNAMNFHLLFYKMSYFPSYRQKRHKISNVLSPLIHLSCYKQNILIGSIGS
jgi:hypothetical protein